MSNPTANQTHVTNNGTAARSINDPGSKTDMTQALKDGLVSKTERETISQFMDKIHEATMEGKEWVETSPEIVRHYNKSSGGLGRAGYFIFQGIKVCETGKSAGLAEKMGRELGKETYGSSEGSVPTSAKAFP